MMKGFPFLDNEECAVVLKEPSVSEGYVESVQTARRRFSNILGRCIGDFFCGVLEPAEHLQHAAFEGTMRTVRD